MSCPVTVACGSPPAGAVGTAYTHTFPTTGGPNLFFSISAGALPPGLILDPATGAVSGKPTTAGTFSFTVKVIDAQILVAGDDGSFSDFKICIASDDGAIWSKVTTAISDSGYSVAYSPDLGLWVNGADFPSTTERVQTSPDGVDGNWTAQTSPADGGNGSVRRIIAGPGQLVALYFRSGTMHIMTSPDGATWTEQSLPGTISNIAPTADLAYSPDLGLYCIADVTPLVNLPGQTGGVLTSPDAVTWTLRYKSANMPCFGLAWGNGLFVALGGIQGSGIHLQTSPDGTNWTTRSDPGGSPQGWSDIYFANGVFVAVSDDISTNPGNQAAWSADGLAWTVVATPGSGKKWGAVAFGYGTWIAGDSGFGSTQPLMKSTDNGATWSLITLSFSYGFINGIAFGPLDNCSDTAPCSITIGGDTFGNVFDGATQHVGNCFA